MKTLNMFYLLIYLTQKVHNGFFFYVGSYCHLSPTVQTISIIVDTFKTIELWFKFLSHF